MEYAVLKWGHNLSPTLLFGAGVGSAFPFLLIFWLMVARQLPWAA